MSVQTIAVPDNPGDVTAWIALTLTALASLTLVGAAPQDLVMVWISTSNADPVPAAPGVTPPGLFSTIVAGPATQGTALPAETWVGVTRLTGPTSGLSLQMGDGGGAKVYQQSTQVAGPIDDTSGVVDLLSFPVTTGGGTRLKVTANIAYRVLAPSGPTTVETKFQLSVDGVDLVDWNESTFDGSSTFFQATSMCFVSGVLAAGPHTVLLTWATDAQSAFSVQVEVNDGGPGFGNRAILAAEEVTAHIFPPP